MNQTVLLEFNELTHDGDWRDSVDLNIYVYNYLNTVNIYLFIVSKILRKKEKVSTKFNCNCTSLKMVISIVTVIILTAVEGQDNHEII